MKTRTLFVVLGLLFASNASATLISNGSFEYLGESDADPNYGSPATWQIYSELPGWDASRTMEVWQSGFNGVAAQDGQQFVELNAHPGNGDGPFSFGQDVATSAGQKYEVSFWARARDNTHESFLFTVGDLIDAAVTTHVLGEWTQIAFQFRANSDSTRVQFTSLDGNGDTTGNLLDDVRLMAIPEPGTLALLLLGAIVLIFSRRFFTSK